MGVWRWVLEGMAMWWWRVMVRGALLGEVEVAAMCNAISKAGRVLGSWKPRLGEWVNRKVVSFCGLGSSILVVQFLSIYKVFAF